MEYVKNEIEIRIESLKSELDKINLNLNRKLSSICDDLFSKTKSASGIDIQLYEDSLIKLRNIVKKYFLLFLSLKTFILYFSKTNKSYEDLALYQTQIKTMNEGLKKLKELNHQVVKNYLLEID